MKRVFFVLTAALSIMVFGLHLYCYLYTLPDWALWVSFAVVTPVYFVIAWQRSMLYGFGAILIRKIDTGNPTTQMSLHRKYSAYSKVATFLYLMCLYIFRVGPLSGPEDINWQTLITGALFMYGVSAVLFFIAERKTGLSAGEELAEGSGGKGG